MFVKFEDCTVIFNLPNSMVDSFIGFSPIYSTVLLKSGTLQVDFCWKFLLDFVILRTIDGEVFPAMTIGTIFKPNNYSGSQKGRQEIWNLFKLTRFGFLKPKKTWGAESKHSRNTTRRAVWFAWSFERRDWLRFGSTFIWILREREESINKETYHIYCSALPLHENTKRLQTRRKTRRKPLREPYSESISSCFVET